MATTFNFIPYNKASASVKVLRQAINGAHPAKAHQRETLQW
jgi:hypothetical protein